MTGVRPEADREVLEGLAPGGVLRAAINLGNSVLAQRDPQGRLSGVAVELAQSLAQRLDAELALVEFAAAGSVVEEVNANRWDIAFLAIDPARSADIFFTQPYVLIEAAFAVMNGSRCKVAADADGEGMRIGTGQGSAYDLFLGRLLKSAVLVRFATARQAFDALVRGECEVAAGVRQVIEGYSRQHGALRVLEPSPDISPVEGRQPRAGAR